MYFERLAQLRKERYINQSKIANMLGIMQTVYSRYERGEKSIPVAHLKKLSEFYDVSIDYIVGRTDVRARIIKEDKWSTWD